MQQHFSPIKILTKLRVSNYTINWNTIQKFKRRKRRGKDGAV